MRVPLRLSDAFTLTFIPVTELADSPRRRNSEAARLPTLSFTGVEAIMWPFFTLTAGYANAAFQRVRGGHVHD